MRYESHLHAVLLAAASWLAAGALAWCGFCVYRVATPKGDDLAWLLAGFAFAAVFVTLASMVRGLMAVAHEPAASHPVPLPLPAQPRRRKAA